MTLPPFETPVVDWSHLALAVGMVAIPAAISAALRLGLVRSLAWGTVRTVVQLTAMGYVLAWLFTREHPLVVILTGLVMSAVAARAARSRAENVRSWPTVLAWASMATSAYFIGFLVCALVIAPEATPWWTPRLAVPILGMLLHNCMTGVTLSLDRFHGGLRDGARRVETLLALGATPWEACRHIVRDALRAGMTPTINALMITGVVSIPGMMTGQILGGVDPRLAVRYQIVVMLMIAACVASGCILLTGTAFRRCFTEDGALAPEFLASSQERRETG